MSQYAGCKDALDSKPSSDCKFYVVGNYVNMDKALRTTLDKNGLWW
jgi:hypothetical protein